MHRNLLIFVGALLLVLATVFCLRMTGTPPTGADGALEVRVYPVPAALGTDIRDSLRTIMFATKEGAQPLGHASLTRPGQLVVSAPEAMHESIAKAVQALSADAAPEAVTAAPATPVAIELWVVGIEETGGEDDASLAPARAALDAAREAMSLGRFVRLQRAAAVGGDGSTIDIRTDTLNANFGLRSGGDGVVFASMRLTLTGLRPLDDGSGRFERFGATFNSKVPLRFGEWQVVGLLSGQALRGDDSPDRLLLLRATRLEPTGS